MEIITLTVDLEIPAQYAEDFADRLNMWSSFCNDGVKIKSITGKKKAQDCPT